MAQKTAALLPATDELLRQFGDRLRLARLRRRLTAKQVAQRAGMAPMTLRSLERGGSGVTMGAYLAVMQVLGIESDLNGLGKADPVGRELQDAQLPAHTRATRPGPPQEQVRKALAVAQPAQARQAADRRVAPDPGKKTLPKASRAAADWITKSGFTSADVLAGLIEPLVLPKKKAR